MPQGGGGELLCNFAVSRGWIIFNLIGLSNSVVYSNAFSQRMGVALLRLPNGLDFSELSPEVTIPPNSLSHMNTANAQGFTNELMPAANAASELLHIDSNLNLASMDSPSPNSSYTMPQPAPMPNMQRNSRSYKVNSSSDAAAITYHTKGGNEVPKNVLDAVTIFTRKQPKGTIDVFWLYDDGGELNYAFRDSLL